MGKQFWKPGNMLYPLPVVMVSCGTMERANIFTVAWTGTVCSDPPMVYISVRRERHSYSILKERGEFVINLVTKKLTRATDFCGVRSGRALDKWEAVHVTKSPSRTVEAPAIAESPVNLECKVTRILPLGSHDMFLAEVTAVAVDDQYLDEKGKFHLNDLNLTAYSHGAYFSLGERIGTFGYSVRKSSGRNKKSDLERNNKTFSSRSRHVASGKKKITSSGQKKKTQKNVSGNNARKKSAAQRSGKPNASGNGRGRQKH